MEGEPERRERGRGGREQVEECLCACCRGAGVSTSLNAGFHTKRQQGRSERGWGNKRNSQQEGGCWITGLASNDSCPVPASAKKLLLWRSPWCVCLSPHTINADGKKQCRFKSFLLFKKKVHKSIWRRKKKKTATTLTWTLWDILKHQQSCVSKWNYSSPLHISKLSAWNNSQSLSWRSISHLVCGKHIYIYELSCRASVQGAIMRQHFSSLHLGPTKLQRQSPGCLWQAGL